MGDVIDFEPLVREYRQAQCLLQKGRKVLPNFKVVELVGVLSEEENDERFSELLRRKPDPNVDDTYVYTVSPETDYPPSSTFEPCSTASKDLENSPRYKWNGEKYVVVVPKDDRDRRLYSAAEYETLMVEIGSPQDSSSNPHAPCIPPIYSHGSPSPSRSLLLLLTS